MFASEGDLHLELPSGDKEAAQDIWVRKKLERYPKFIISMTKLIIHYLLYMYMKASIMNELIENGLFTFLLPINQV